MEESIEEVYFNWLYSKVASVEFPTPSLTYYTLFRDLHSKEFVWLVPGDDNRAEDGLDLRIEFFRQSLMDYDPPWASIGCSVLEMLIAFSRKAEFETEIPVRQWFWIFLSNLGLDELCDANTGISRKVGEVLDRFVWRTYSRNGRGGICPLTKPKNDQRKIEIWYQFCEFLIELEV